MVITDILNRNAQLYGKEVALIEINPEQHETRHTWKENELVEPQGERYYRREITWQVFNEKANRLANLLGSRGYGKGNKIAILMMNSLEWLPIYFGVLKSGALAVPMNFRYASDEILYCANLADVDILIFGPEFIGRVEEIAEDLTCTLLYCGPGITPTFADNYNELTADCSSDDPGIALTPEDDAAIYFSSGTTGFPKAILHNHLSLMHACLTEQAHHGQTKDDIFLCIPPLYHTGAKMHW
ncbi:MAG: acyl--CoA ligase, partial [Clostridia bacterium]|nr:acyl--CoA ligase [Clostridia bacterium]